MKGYGAISSLAGKENSRREMIVVRTMKLRTDIEQLLTSYFVRSDKECKTVYED